MAVPPPLSPPHPDKAGLRAALRDARRAHVAETDAAVLAAQTAALNARLLPLLDAHDAFAAYLAHRGEPDILPFLHQADAGGHTIALPHIGDTMRFVVWRPDAALHRGPLGIAQPDPAQGEIEPDILLMPLVAFDRRGGRLGQGGGYYDRWCAVHSDVRRIGIAWSFQEVPQVPRDAWDMTLDAIATEAEWITP